MKPIPQPPRLIRLRHCIDAIDDLIAYLLMLRAATSRAAQELKAQHHLPPRDRGREKEIQRHYEIHHKGASAVARVIMDLCRHEQ